MTSFKEIKISFREYMLSLGYSKNTLDSPYQWIFFRLDRFMSECGETNYTPEIGKAFLENELDTAGCSDRCFTHRRIAIRRLNDFIAGQYVLTTTKVEPAPECFSKDFDDYLESMRLRGLRESTVMQHYYSGLKMLHGFSSARIDNLSDIKPQDIYDVFARNNDKSNISRTLRSFLRHLYKSGTLSCDFSVFVPSVRKRQPVPSVYTKDETGQLLSSIDMTLNSGKRNYVILLLALRLGIRSGDIVNLKISDFDFQSNVIEFVQEKTGVAQRMEFLPELKDAIRIYLDKGRPDTKHPNLFISVRPPFRPITVMAVTSLITRCMKKSGITIGSRQCGGHSLRMTLASELVSEKVPYEAVRKILGHEDTKSMKHYVKFDVAMLRSCSLEVPPVTGLFAEFINSRKGGKR